MHAARAAQLSAAVLEPHQPQVVEQPDAASCSFSHISKHLAMPSWHVPPTSAQLATPMHVVVDCIVQLVHAPEAQKHGCGTPPLVYCAWQVVSSVHVAHAT
ncbi:MAG: hypothetical protein Q8J97_01315 [Flavobacteriaceae bacterium]|nr:hypothetical protein [Flavobacteriaceae bacterium]